MMVQIDIQMPKSCKDCPFCHEKEYEEVNDSYYGDDPEKVYICGLLDFEVFDSDCMEDGLERNEECPLIDKEHEEQMKQNLCTTCGNSYCKQLNCALFKTTVCKNYTKRE